MNEPLTVRLAVIVGILVIGLGGCTEPTREELVEPMPTAQTALQYAKDAYQNKDYELAAEWFRKAAEQGDAKGQYNLGLFYNEGKGLPQNYDLAAEWFHKSAEQGLVQAQNNLGVLYQQGQGVPKDETQATLWFRKAAEQGYAQAQKNLGLAYRDGLGVSKDLNRASYWLGKAAAQGDVEAQLALKEPTPSESQKKKNSKASNTP